MALALALSQGVPLLSDRSALLCLEGVVRMAGIKVVWCLSRKLVFVFDFHSQFLVPFQFSKFLG